MKISIICISLIIILPGLHGKLMAQGPDSWVRKSDLPGIARTTSVSFSIHGKGYVGTGQDSSGNFLKEFWQYDPSLDTWTQKADFAGSARTAAIGFSIDSSGYIGLGYDGTDYLKDLWKYDPLLNSWSQSQDLGLYSSNVVAGRRDASVTVSDGKAYVIGGYDGATAYIKQCWSFDPEKDTAWAKRRNFANATEFTVIGRRWGVAFSLSSTVYFGCGYDYSHDYKKDLWAYNTSLDSWSQVADLPGQGRSNASAFTLYGKAYVFCGVNAAPQNDMWRYDPSGNNWTRVADYPGNANTNNIAFSIHHRAYAGLGYDNANQCQKDLWEYIPDSTSGIAESVSTMIFHISPNPVTDHFIISTETMIESGDAELILYSSNGKIVLKKKLGQFPILISRSGIQSGLYYYSLRSKKYQPNSGKIIFQ
jgi:N-acetylneuraminic acid mutarotase